MRPVAWPARGPATPLQRDPAHEDTARLCAVLQTVALALLAFLGIRWGVAAARIILYPFEWSTMDGYFVAYGQRLLAGQAIYSSHVVPPMGFEYVPGYLLFLAPLNALFGPAVWVERALALGFTGAIAAMTGHIVRVRTGSFAWGIIAVALCVAPPVVSEWYLVRGLDLAVLSLGLGATALIAEPKRLTIRWVMAAAVLYVAGFYCKQTIVFAWAAGVAILFVRERSLLRAFLTLTIGGGVACGLVLHVWSGGWFWDNAFATTARNPMHPRLLVGLVLAFAPWVAIPLAGAGAAAFWRPRDTFRHPWVLYWGACVASMGTAAKLGAAVVYFLPVYIATVMLVCQFAPVFLHALPYTRLRAGLIVCVIVQLLVWFARPLPVPTDAGARYAGRFLDGIRARPGRILVERADSFATLAGREVEWEAVQLPILHNVHDMPLDTLLEDLREQRYAAVLYSGRYYTGVYWLRRTIFTYYRPVPSLQSLPVTLFYGDEAYTLLEPKPPEDLPAVPLVPVPGEAADSAGQKQWEVQRTKRVT